MRVWNETKNVNRGTKLAFALAGSLVLAACGPGASPSPTESPTAAPTPTATPGAGQPTPTVTPTPSPTPDPTQPTTLTYDFTEGEQGWEADFADYTAQVEPGDPVAGIEDLPPSAPDDADGPAFLIAATNRPDDVFMFLKRQVGPDEGLQPETPYQLEYRITFLSDAPSNCAGIGGAPGEAVTMKAGASTEEPEVVEQNGDFRLSVDKGNQSTGGPAATVIGDVANGIPCEEALEQEPQPFAQVTHEASHTEAVETDADGQLWLLVGTDSGFEGRTTLYYQVIEVTLTPAEAATSE